VETVRPPACAPAEDARWPLPLLLPTVRDGPAAPLRSGLLMMLLPAVGVRCTLALPGLAEPL
jgi:hypothetical protein